MMTHRTSRSFILSSLLILLSACGFSLRGSDMLSNNLGNLQLYSAQANSELSRLLLRSLENADVNVVLLEVDQATDDIPLLGIANEAIQSRPVTVNSRARAAQIELRMSVDIALMLGERSLIPTETLFVERTYFQDIENISGNQEEVEIISAEMRRELINQLIRRLAAVKPPPLT
jgi:LPS-assembly lipoprotein